MKKNKEWLKEEVKKASNNYPTYHDERDDLIKKMVNMHEILELINQLDEPELPVIPQFVADWIEHIKKDKSWLSLYGALNYSDQVQGETKKWLSTNNSDLFARAWLDGYTIEKEKMYVVKINDQGSWLYLKSMQLYKDVESRTDLNSNFEAWKEKAIKFTNKEQAEGIAKFFNGEVEEVTDNV